MKVPTNIWCHLDFWWLKVHAEQLRKQTRWDWIIQQPKGPSLRAIERKYESARLTDWIIQRPKGPSLEIFEWKRVWKCKVRKWKCKSNWSRWGWIIHEPKGKSQAWEYLKCTISLWMTMFVLKHYFGRKAIFFFLKTIIEVQHFLWFLTLGELKALRNYD